MSKMAYTIKLHVYIHLNTAKINVHVPVHWDILYSAQNRPLQLVLRVNKLWAEIHYTIFCNWFIAGRFKQQQHMT